MEDCKLSHYNFAVGCFLELFVKHDRNCDNTLGNNREVTAFEGYKTLQHLGKNTCGAWYHREACYATYQYRNINMNRADCKKT